MAQINKNLINFCIIFFLALYLLQLVYSNEEKNFLLTLQKAYPFKKIKKQKILDFKLNLSDNILAYNREYLFNLTDYNSKNIFFNKIKENNNLKLYTTIEDSKSPNILDSNTIYLQRKHNIANLKNKKIENFNDLYKFRIKKAQKEVLIRLMNQLGKPYRWGGISPSTGFDCSGLVYYAYKDLVKFRIPRTANEMYHLRCADHINRDKLESGDLVFFHTHSHSVADHVGVYVGHGKFIQSPRSGQDIRITSLSEEYWQRHYIGAIRVVTLKTIR